LSIGFVTLFTFSALGYFTHVLRLLLTIIFVGSFLLRPLIMTPISAIWVGILDSEKPVFTLTFGGIGGIATTINEALKHL
jgi:hypothetical protein